MNRVKGQWLRVTKLGPPRDILQGSTTVLAVPSSKAGIEFS